MGARRRGWRRWLAAAPLGRLAAGAALCALGSTAISTATAVEFAEIARFNVASHQVGTHAATVAWQSGKLFLGGYNSSGSHQDVSIVEVLNPATTGVVAVPAFGQRFSPVRVGGAMGFSGLALSADGSRLAAALYNGTTASNTGLQLFTLGAPGVAPPLPMTKTLVGGNGVAFDPGYFDGQQTTGSGVAWVAHHTLAGADRRMLQDAATLADIYTPANGMLWYPEELDGLFRRTRDIDFDPATGDMYTRITNDVGVARRTGGNSVDLATSILLVDSLLDAPSVDNQHLAFLSTPLDGGMVVYNDRPWNQDAQPAPQAFADVVKLVSSSGTPLPANFGFLDGYHPAAGAGWYDFDFDEASQTLALLDASNAQVHIFQVGAAAAVPNNGDFDSDGDVDGADFLTWQRNVGVNNGTATLAHGDADGDRHVTGEDLAIWRAQFGAAAPAIHAVPEPAAWALFGATGLGFGALSRKRRR